VLATLHANSANQALDRIINFFPTSGANSFADGPVAEHPRAHLAAAHSARIGRRPHRRHRDQC